MSLSSSSSYSFPLTLSLLFLCLSISVLLQCAVAQELKVDNTYHSVEISQHGEGDECGDEVVAVHKINNMCDHLPLELIQMEGMTVTYGWGFATCNSDGLSFVLHKCKDPQCEECLHEYFPAGSVCYHDTLSLGAHAVSSVCVDPPRGLSPPATIFDAPIGMYDFHKHTHDCASRTITYAVYDVCVPTDNGKYSFSFCGVNGLNNWICDDSHCKSCILSHSYPIGVCAGSSELELHRGVNSSVVARCVAYVAPRPTPTPTPTPTTTVVSVVPSTDDGATTSAGSGGSNGFLVSLVVVLGFLLVLISGAAAYLYLSRRRYGLPVTSINLHDVGMQPFEREEYHSSDSRDSYSESDGSVPSTSRSAVSKYDEAVDFLHQTLTPSASQTSLIDLDGEASPQRVRKVPSNALSKSHGRRSMHTTPRDRLYQSARHGSNTYRDSVTTRNPLKVSAPVLRTDFDSSGLNRTKSAEYK